MIDTVAVRVASATLVAVSVIVCTEEMLEGAVYSPVELTLPTPVGFNAHVTAVLDAFKTVLVNCCVSPLYSVTVPGVTVIVSDANSVTAAETVSPDCVVAVTDAVVCEGIDAGAEYRPALLSVPGPVSVHVTPVPQAGGKIAVNCCV
jgi:hypothetical protein